MRAIIVFYRKGDTSYPMTNNVKEDQLRHELDTLKQNGHTVLMVLHLSSVIQVRRIEFLGKEPAEEEKK